MHACMHVQVYAEWSNFKRDARDEIKYLEQAVLESNSVSSKGSKKSKLAKRCQIKIKIKYGKCSLN